MDSNFTRDITHPLTDEDIINARNKIVDWAQQGRRLDKANLRLQYMMAMLVSMDKADEKRWRKFEKKTLKQLSRQRGKDGN